MGRRKENKPLRIRPRLAECLPNPNTLLNSKGFTSLKTHCTL
jgi:hypothetical protein